MKIQSSLRLRAANLLVALDVVVPKSRKRPINKRRFIVTLNYSASKKELLVSESKHDLRAQTVDAAGKWSGEIQVDGWLLKKATEKFTADDELELIALDTELCIICGSSQFRILRADPGGSGGVERKPIPKNPRHKGPVTPAPDPIAKRVELGDNWDFSARVPVPQHRDPKK